MGKLSATTIASVYTLLQIDEKITYYQEILDTAAAGGYQLDTTSGDQRITPPDPVRVGELLQVYLKARQIQTGESSVRFYRGEYRPKTGPV